MSLSLISKRYPVVYALNLMDTLFTDAEMQGHLLIEKKKSRSNMEGLDHSRVKKLFGKYDDAWFSNKGILCIIIIGM